MMEDLDWLVLQLADSAFPAGGFAHSAGLEAAVQLGEVDAATFERFVTDVLWQAGWGALPLVRAAHHAPEKIREWDARCDAFLLGHVTNRASRTQGRAFIATCAQSFQREEGVALAPVADSNRGAAALAPRSPSDLAGGTPTPRSLSLLTLAERVRDGELRGHLAPLFGAALAILGVPERRALQLFLHLTLRTVLSAAVRLGHVGPHEGQGIQRACAAVCAAVLARCGELPVEALAQTAPLVELTANLQDRLYSRLFQS